MSAAMSSASRHRAPSLQSGRSSNRGRTGEMKDFAMAPTPLPRYFEPCAATAAMFLYAQGSSIVCCHHDTLSIERRFSRHSDEIQLLAVDNQSELGAGRLVVSYDAGQNAIVWDLMTGDEVARFASYEHLTAAAWMRSGNVAFGNTQGNIILFEPQTSEHISARTIDQIAVTALAPSADCRTFAIGYQNGQCLVATLQPRFTILHNLITSRGPSPIVTLHWHASSARQRSDMLASQTQDGDLRVWSVAKSHSSNDPAKVVRILKKTEDYRPGPNWMAWSKNGRIIQYSESETLSWDVRTKHVTSDSIPTLEHVRGLAVYGPGATLFTLGANNTVQQFDLNTPAIMVSNVQHPANLLPPSPPVSIEEPDKATTIASESEITFNPSDVGISESDDDHMSPYQRIQHTRERDRERERRYDGYDTASMASSQSGLSGYSVESGGSKTPAKYPASLRSGRLTENTYISAGSSATGTRKGAYNHSDMYSQSSLNTTSTRSKRRPSRLRHEIQQDASPVQQENKVMDLFKFTRSRLSDVPFKAPLMGDSSRLTNDDLRRQMLSIIFGWNRTIEELVSDEMSRHPQGSSSRIMLAKWLGLVDQDMASSESMTSSDWMLLALSGIGGGQASPQHKLGRAYVQSLLGKGDIHAAATILIGLGDQNDAIEIYTAHKRYMEAVILTTLFFPGVWERQCAIVKRWGEWAVQHGQQELAIRCFACAGQESTEPWASPSASQLTFQNINNPSINEVLSPPMSPPGLNRGPQRQIGKNSALKLITTFDNSSGKSKFFSQADGGATPIAAGVTPIIESAIDRNMDLDPMTAIARPSQKSGFNTPTSTRSYASSAFSNINPLPSIGETHGEPGTPPTEKKRYGGHSRRTSIDNVSDTMSAGISLPRAATASPMMMRDNYQRIGMGGEGTMPGPDSIMGLKMESTKRHRNGSRDRMPEGLSLQLQSLEMPNEPDPPSPDHSVASSARYHWPSRRRGPGSVSSVTSASTNRSVRSTASRRQPLDGHVKSIDVAKKTKARSRHASRERDLNRGRATSRDRHGSREQSPDRGRTPGRAYNNGKRSPTSPVPMSPEDLLAAKNQDSQGVSEVDGSALRSMTTSRASSRGASRTRSRSRRPPPISTSTQATPAYDGGSSDDEKQYQIAVEQQEHDARKRAESWRQKRSTSRGSKAPPTPSSVREKDGYYSRPGSRQQHDRATPESYSHRLYKDRSTSREASGDINGLRLDQRMDRELRKEEAQLALEAKRRDLSRGGNVPPPLPLENSNHAPFRLAVEPQSAKSDLPPRSKTADPYGNSSSRGMYARGPMGHPPVGLPATPKAMRLVLDSDPKNGHAPSVPPLPAAFQKASPPPQEPSPKNESQPQEEPPKKDEEPTLTLLPSTVYQPPSRPPPRCMSAPIPDDPLARMRQTSSGRSGGGLSRNQSVRSKTGRDLDGIREDSGRVPIRRGSVDQQSQVPPPPPVGHGVPSELQHLAMPPPPPPAPLPHVAGMQQRPNALAAGMIEIVMDEDDNQNQIPPPPPPPPAAPAMAPQPIHIPPTEITVPVLPPPAPPSLKGGHSRGRSTTENSISGRFSKATERLRSASRTRKEPGYRGHKSPEVAPYESIPPPMGYPQAINTQNLPTGLHESELI